MRPKKPIMLRVPLHPPPPAAELEKRGQYVMRLRKMDGAEDRDEAYKRAKRTMPWGARIAEPRAYFSGAFWCFVCVKEAA
jgi:hypothetical protein